ncbi:MAG TPA: TetR/AcrR family transcriptional regulator [Dongiaceae bacterium]|nr:TetR/AcrR family transcriptional regulator [Dongiaceae bacterium]
MATSPLPDRRSRRSAEIRERIFRAALELFERKGFAETAVEDITNAADIGKGTFFNYFPSKDHILLAFGEMQIGKLREAVHEAKSSAQPIPEFLQGLGRRMTQEPMRHPTFVRALLQAFLSSEPVREAMVDMQKQILAIHAEMISLGQQRGEIRSDLVPSEIAMVFRQAIFGTLLIWSLYGDGSLLERMNAVFNILWTGLAPRNNSEPHPVSLTAELSAPMFF